MHDLRHRTLAGSALAAAVIGTSFVTAGCGSAAHPAAAKSVAKAASFQTASATLGSLTISRAYVPKPASPSVAAAYFTVADSGAADTLLSVGSSASTDVGLHQTVNHGNVGVMVPIATIAVPAGGSVALAPGGYHVMMMNPTALTVGAEVTLTLHFAHAGTVTMQVPVVPLTATDDDSAAMSGMGS